MLQPSPRVSHTSELPSPPRVVQLKADNQLTQYEKNKPLLINEREKWK